MWGISSDWIDLPERQTKGISTLPQLIGQLLQMA